MRSGLRDGREVCEGDEVWSYGMRERSVRGMRSGLTG